MEVREVQEASPVDFYRRWNGAAIDEVAEARPATFDRELEFRRPRHFACLLRSPTSRYLPEATDKANNGVMLMSLCRS